MSAVLGALRRATRRPSLPASARRWVRPLLAAVLAVGFLGVLATSVFPTSTWLDQRRALADTRAELESLQAERADLEARIAELDDDAEIEALARSQYGLVLPGEEAYAVLPAPEVVVPLPPLFPFQD